MVNSDDERCTPPALREGHAAVRLVEDPITGLPVLDCGSDAPTLTSEQVEALLADFPIAQQGQKRWE